MADDYPKFLVLQAGPTGKLTIVENSMESQRAFEMRRARPGSKVYIDEIEVQRRCQDAYARGAYTARSFPRTEGG